MPTNSPKVVKIKGKWCVACPNCGAMRQYSVKCAANGAVRNKTVCTICKAALHYPDYDHKNEFYKIWRTAEGKWIAECPQCGVERAFKGRRHALSAARCGSKCRSCASKGHRRVGTIDGIKMGDVSRFRDNAAARGYEFRLTVENVVKMWDNQGGRCAISGIEMSKSPRTWSLDRKDNSLGYTPENVWLVEKRLNIMRNVIGVEEFIQLCEAVAEWNGDR